MKVVFIFILFAYCSNCVAQNILKDANVITVKGVSFNEVCNALLDSGYVIDKKDSELQTVRTEKKKFPKYWKAIYTVNIRVKDSIAYISGLLTSPPEGGLFVDQPISNHTNSKGKTFPKSMYGYPFLLLNDFALGFKKEVGYLKK
jgi:hypothetical protein